MVIGDLLLLLLWELSEYMDPWLKRLALGIVYFFSDY